MLFEKRAGNSHFQKRADYSFPYSQFLHEGYCITFGLDQNNGVGCIMLFVLNNISPKLISPKKLSIENFWLESNLRKKKCFLHCSSNPNNGNSESHLDSISVTIDSLLTKYDNTLLIGYFTSSVDDSHMKSLKGTLMQI